jgi:hypothetical protein
LWEAVSFDFGWLDGISDRTWHLSLSTKRGMPLAAGVLHPFAGQLFSSMVAALAMRFSSVSVIAKTLRLRGRGMPLSTRPAMSSRQG